MHGIFSTFVIGKILRNLELCASVGLGYDLILILICLSMQDKMEYKESYLKISRKWTSRTDEQNLLFYDSTIQKIGFFFS